MDGNRRMMAACVGLVAVMGVAAGAAMGQQITVKVAPTGTWPQQAWGSPTAPEPTNKMMALDSVGNMYIVGQGGSLSGTKPPYNISLWKYSINGTLLWQRIWSDPAYKSSYGVAVGIESDGSAVYVAGAGLSGSQGGDVPPVVEG
jgi:hypothetical protein